ncbi:hypothetical protein BKH41_06245 [Helicobacter sp. 12S02232-10]|uniref:flagellar hook-length control protein FliK n=1 Tax=Helicobacter sp. 12S02232-10 TaxID=1476197 RepID=UPI000BA632D4|nr:flagellar hook-length control protein FliK [Helicobacter sp. 12S02232-10]PAF48312.1 hypothetical protein BKH41_06245 [Helicobacter sp. 12S02232-10]
MLENILNNVNASQEIKNTPEKKKVIDKNSKEDGFQKLLQKNLLAQNVNLKDQENNVNASQEIKNTPEKKKVIDKNSKEDGFQKPLTQKTNLKDQEKIESVLNKNSEKKALPSTDGAALEKNISNPATFDFQEFKNNSLSKNSQEPSTKETIKEDHKTLSNPSEKKLSDVKTLGEQKNFQPKNINIENNQQNPKSNNTPPLKDLPTQDMLTQKLKNQSQASLTKTEEDKPLSVILKTLDQVDTKEIKARKKFNQEHKIEYKIEGKDEKIAVIERGTHLPKNIIGSKIEKKESQTQETPSKNQPLSEAISQVFIKEVKPKTIAIAEDKDQDSKQNTQKKTKKSEVLPKNATTSNPNASRSTPSLSTQTQNEQLENQKAIQEDNAQFSLNEKTKKKQNNQEIQKDKEKIKQTPTKEKDSAPTLGLASVKNDLIYKNANAKETIKNFAQSFKEEIKKFKPPMSKISLELHPEKLGKLELTIKQTGKNLQVSVVSNHQAIALFVQNQAELRQNLSMIGFSGIDLNFSSQEDSQKGHQDRDNQKRNKNSLKQYQEVKNISQIPYDTMEITLPKYA